MKLHGVNKALGLLSTIRLHNCEKSHMTHGIILDNLGGSRIIGHYWQCVKSVRIWSFSGPHFPAFGLNTERYSVPLRIQSKCGKIRTRKTPNTDTFHVVILEDLNKACKTYIWFKHLWSKASWFVGSLFPLPITKYTHSLKTFFYQNASCRQKLKPREFLNLLYDLGSWDFKIEFLRLSRMM